MKKRKILISSIIILITLILLILLLVCQKWIAYGKLAKYSSLTDEQIMECVSFIAESHTKKM